MRNRLMAVLMAIVVTVLLVYGIPRAYSLATLVQGYEASQVETSADLVAALVSQQSQEPAGVTEDFLRPLPRAGESLQYTAADGSMVQVGAPSSEHSSDDLVQTRQLSDGAQVTLRRSGDLVETRILTALAPLVLLGLALAVGSAVVGHLLARRLTRPFVELATTANTIGEGRFDVPVPHYHLAEAEAIGEALRKTSAQLSELSLRERDVAINASHELRSPISALRMEIEDLASWPQTHPEVAAELTSYLPQLDRLSAAVRTYLDTARRERLTGVDVTDLADLVDEALDRHLAGLHGAEPGPELTKADPPAEPLLVLASRAAVADILDNLLRHAGRRHASRVLVRLEGSPGFARVRLELTGAEPEHLGDEERAAATRVALSVDGRVAAQGAELVLTLPRAEQHGT